VPRCTRTEGCAFASVRTSKAAPVFYQRVVTKARLWQPKRKTTTTTTTTKKSKKQATIIGDGNDASTVTASENLDSKEDYAKTSTDVGIKGTDREDSP
jgi:hypothetical protein